METEILINGNLHIYDVPWSVFNPDGEGVMVHVEGDLFVHRKEDDFIYPASDRFMENLFENHEIQDIILYSPKFKSNQ